MENEQTHQTSKPSKKLSKQEIYKDLDELNLAIGIITLKCEHLEALKAFPPGLFTRSRELAKELTMEVARKMAEILNTREIKEYVRFVRLQDQQDAPSSKRPKCKSVQSEFARETRGHP